MAIYQGLSNSTIARFCLFDVRVLTGNEIIEAKKLLYRVFVLEQHWKIPLNNPTYIRVESGMLCDMYDAIATWFGVFHHDTLIACNRACARLNGSFELEHYHPLPPFIKNDEMSIEVNRLVIQPEYRSTLALLALTHFVAQYLLDHGTTTLFTTSSFPRPGNFYVRRFGFIKDEESFRYHVDDPNAVHLLYMDADRIQTSMHYLTRILEGNQSLNTPI